MMAFFKPPGIERLYSGVTNRMASTAAIAFLNSAATGRQFASCVRVEDPVALAEWALKSENGWTRDRIMAAINGPQPLQVSLTRPIQVILFYITATVMPDDGSAQRAQDICGHDAKLDRALRRKPTR